MSKPIEILGPLIPFSINKETLEVTILATKKNSLIDMCLAEGHTYIDKRDNTALIEALIKYDNYRKSQQIDQPGNAIDQPGNATFH